MKKEAEIGLYIFGGILLIIIFLVVAKCFPEHLNSTVLLGTALVILFYTYFTHGLRDETRKQNELNTRPILVPFFRNDLHGIGWHLVVCNVGQGSAIDIGLDIQPKIYHTLFPVSAVGSQEERAFAPRAEKQIKFVMDDHIPERNDSYSTSLSQPEKISIPYREKFITWSKETWSMNFYYHDVDGRRWHTFARKKKGEFVVHDVKIRPS